ncbi:MAG: NADPH-dependent oxidoreductase [Myxococcales bacterium]|nr:MAG: NADPH-dependent oxidoreductase [Myxococcales bacterium]
MDTPQPQLAELLRQRYAGVVPGRVARVGAPVTELLLSHRSVRQYSSRAAPEGTVELLVAAAQSAASSSNLQLWSVVSVEDAELRRKLSVAANSQAHVRDSAVFLVWLADLNRATRLARAHDIEPEGLDYLEMFLMASVDAALAAQNAVVAAEAAGLSTVYIGALRNRPEEVAEVLALPEGVFALFGLCVGYADSASAAIKPRLPQSVVLGRDRYQPLNAELVREYDERMTAFYGEQQMQVPAGGWSLHSAQRVKNAASLSGRHRLVEALKARGFGLR